MTRGEVRQLARFLGAFAALTIIILGAPLMLLFASRRRFDSASPLSGVPAPWRWDLGAIANDLADPLADALVIDLILRTCLVVLWIAIVVIAATTLAEVVHLLRHGGLSLPSIRGLGWAQPIARFIAAGLLVLVPLVSPKASLASAGGRQLFTSVVTEVDVTAAAPQTARYPGQQTDAPTPRVHVVEQGESVYSIADSLASSVGMSTAEVADLILDENLGKVMTTGLRFTNPAYIEAGWELVIPADVLPRTTTVRSGSVPAPSSGRPSAVERVIEPNRAPDHTTPTATNHVVRRGETLSSIARQHLGDADDWPRIWSENAGAVMNDGRLFDDPDLILPGWSIDVPLRVDGGVGSEMTETEPDVVAPFETETDGAHRETSGIDVTATDEPDDEVDGDDVTSIVEGPQSVIPTATPHPTGPPPGNDVQTTPAPSVSHTTPSTTAVPAAGSPGDAESGGRPDGPDAPSPLRLEHAGFLAAGILTLVGLRRRQRLRRALPRSRIPAPRSDVVATERRLRTLDPGERSARVDVAIRAAAHALADTGSQIGLIIVGPDGEIEIVLTAPADLPAPWTKTANAIDGDVRIVWHLAASVPVEVLGQDARRVGTPCVALVQLGVAAERDVLIDLEACGTLAVEAHGGRADEVVTALAAGLASSPYAEVAHLVGVSLPPEALLDHRNAHRAGSVGDAFEMAASLAGSTVTNDRSSFSLRSRRTGGEMWEPAVVLLLDHDIAADSPGASGSAARSLPAAGRGLAVVVSVEPATWSDAPARLVGGADGWTLRAFGTTTSLVPVGLSADDLADVVDVLDDANAALIVEDQPTGRNVPANADPTTEVFAPSDDEPFEPMDHAIVVRLIGGVEVVGRNGDSGVFERSKTVELIAWLATHRERSTRAAARTALWELDVRDATFANVVSEARRALGRLVEPDGDEEWLARTLTEKLPLHPAVVTDAQLMEERLTRACLQSPAQAIGTLRPAAEMIRDMPFAGTSYLWPDAEGITSNFVLLATGVSTELAAHALSLGDIDLVFWATGQGLKVLPGHEALIALRMRAHARAGDLAGVRQEWESYERVIVADAWSDGEPAPKLLELRRELLSSPT